MINENNYTLSDKVIGTIAYFTVRPFLRVPWWLDGSTSQNIFSFNSYLRETKEYFLDRAKQERLERRSFRNVIHKLADGHAYSLGLDPRSPRRQKESLEDTTGINAPEF